MGKEYVDTICVGLECFSNKIGYQSDVYAKNEETIKYLVCDVYIFRSIPVHFPAAYKA